MVRGREGIGGRIGKQAMTMEWHAWVELSVGCASCA